MRTAYLPASGGSSAPALGGACPLLATAPRAPWLPFSSPGTSRSVWRPLRLCSPCLLHLTLCWVAFPVCCLPGWHPLSGLGALLSLGKTYTPQPALLTASEEPMARGLRGAYAVSEKYAPLCLLPPTPVSGPVVYTDCGDKAWRAPSWGVGVPLSRLSLLSYWPSVLWLGVEGCPRPILTLDSQQSPLISPDLQASRSFFSLLILEGHLSPGIWATWLIDCPCSRSFFPWSSSHCGRVVPKGRGCSSQPGLWGLVGNPVVVSPLFCCVGSVNPSDSLTLPRVHSDLKDTRVPWLKAPQAGLPWRGRSRC